MSDPVDALIEVLRRYLARRGSIIVPTAKAGGQARLKIAFRGLYKSMAVSIGGYDRFEDIVAAIRSDPRLFAKLESLGVKFVKLEGEDYIEVPVDLLEKLMGEKD